VLDYPPLAGRAASLSIRRQVMALAFLLRLSEVSGIPSSHLKGLALPVQVSVLSGGKLNDSISLLTEVLSQ
jgi:hypothetical protein